MASRIAPGSRSRSRRVLVATLAASSLFGATRLVAAEGAESNRSDPNVSASVSQEPSAVPDEALARARAVVAVAEPLFLAGHYVAALAEYSRAYEILAGHPRQYWVLHNLAACNERLFRYDLAVELYEEYLRRAPAAEEDRREVEAVLGTLRSLLATLVIETSVPGSVWLDDRQLGVAPGRWRVPAGRHIVEVRAEHYESARREVQLNPGQLHVDRFEMQLLYQGPPRGYFWAAVGLAGAATVAGATAGFMALSAREQGRQNAELYQDTQPDAERTRHLALAADIGFGTAVVFGATATVLYFVTDWRRSEDAGGHKREPSARRSLNIAPAAPGGIGATLRGEF